MHEELISRAKVVDVLRETGIIQDNELGNMVVNEINRIPVAYDVKQVIKNVGNLPTQDILGVDHIPMTAAINHIKYGGNSEPPNSVLQLSGDYIRGYTKAIQNMQEIVESVSCDKKLNNKSIKELLNCVLKHRAEIRERKNGFIRWNIILKKFEWYNQEV